ncbi:FecR protein [Polystyrenella longa]|uniref:FecR protein n=1 Tax=Polystyrenella longa TaxID=2528007 RepID=A0A518CPT3_9PLAN|nr:FecR domain-containing protein [Polystyrenella longa]QDU81236.1 FecR protein [Polystyrenella longa]
MNPSQQSRLLDLLDSQLQQRLSKNEHQELETLLLDDSGAQKLYHDYLELSHNLNQHFDTEHVDTEPLTKPAMTAAIVDEYARNKRWFSSYIASAVVVLILFFAVQWYLAAPWYLAVPPVKQAPVSVPITPVMASSEVASFTQLADARFLDHSLWKMGDPIKTDDEFTLRSGLVKLKATGGAEVILEGPAVFEWKSPLELVLKYGRCSVHVPEAADKIEVQTPTSRVVDLGTSFAIDVTESGESEVQLIEGMADVYLPEKRFDSPERLTEGDARQYGREVDRNSIAIPFDGERYRSQLPDRVVAYQAHDTGNGIDELERVTIQRGGRLFDYDVSELTSVNLTHFSGVKSPSYLTVPLSAPNGGAALLTSGNRHALLDNDSLLTTGVINLSGEASPLQSSPVMNASDSSSNTAGLAVRFRQPVINHAGPDIVLFDLHVLVHSEEGDAFHVSPLEWRDGLHAIMINKFDITLSSPEAQLLAPFRLVKLDKQAHSLNELEQTPIQDSIEHIVRARILAVGIDLSDLGFSEGELVEGLFLQDLMDDGSFLDPVFIGGLPAIDP